MDPTDRMETRRYPMDRSIRINIPTSTRTSSTAKAFASLSDRIFRVDLSAGVETNRSLISDGKAAGAIGFHRFVFSAELGQSCTVTLDSAGRVSSWIEIFLISPRSQDPDSGIGITKSHRY